MMARKDLLKNLMLQAVTPADGATPAPSDAVSTPRTPRPSRGAIGAVSQSIADLKSRSITEVAADMIDDAGLTDRLDEDPDGIAALMESIRSYGQQVPVLVRHHANVEGRYEVVYGRRRVAALKRLGQPVKVMIRELSDRELVIAQGQENAARKDLTFIEKANFAAQMQAGGYDRAVICDALHVDKTVISRMLQVAQAVPDRLIRAIGAAPAIGRDRWLLLARRLEGRSLSELLALASGDTSDARFESLFAGLAEAPAPAAEAKPAATTEPLTGADGAALGDIRRRKDGTVLTLRGTQGFDDWLLSRIEDLHRAWLEDRND